MHPFILAVIGGALIGTAAVAMMGLNGRIAGVSGILAGIFTQPKDERSWRLLFVIGLLLGGAVPTLLLGLELPRPPTANTALILVAGLLVGVGTGLGSGCTSGHGICGMARGSRRSLVATLVFMAAGAIAVYVLRHLTGG